MEDCKILYEGDEDQNLKSGLLEELGFKSIGVHDNMRKCWLMTYDTVGFKHVCTDEGFAELKELTLPQLRDLVAQIKSKVREYLDPNDNYKFCLINPSDAAHWMIEVPEGAEAYFKYGDGTFFVKFPPDWESSNFCDGEWIESAHWSREDILGDMKGRLLWSRQPTQEQGLISGADALRALADGKEVEFNSQDKWLDIRKYPWDLNIILNNPNGIKFRLKPRTIKLSLEIPAPFEPKEGEKYWHLYAECKSGYDFEHYGNGDDWSNLGAWRTEEEIKQVVAALRRIKG